MIPTCFVLMSHGPVIVNVEDYHTDLGPLCDADGNLLEGQQGALPLDPPSGAAPVVYFLEKSGKRHFVVTGDGKRVENVEGIDVEGYANEKDGWAAIAALNKV